MPINQTDIQTYLHDHVHRTSWQLLVPQRGFSKGRCFIGISAQQKVFVKLGADTRMLHLLSNAHLTPQYLAGGRFKDDTITVQIFVEGNHPDRAWFAANASSWAHLVQTLQSLASLRKYLPCVASESYQSLFTSYVQQITDLVSSIPIDPVTRQRIDGLLAQYAVRIPFVQGTGLVPTHGDPNRDNLLVTPTHVYLLDWDTLHV